MTCYPGRIVGNLFVSTLTPGQARNRGLGDNRYVVILIVAQENNHFINFIVRDNGTINISTNHFVGMTRDEITLQFWCIIT
jgi:hypothetical protein